MKFAYQSSNYPTGYDVPMVCEKLYGKKEGPYLVSINGAIHFFAVCDDFGNLLGPNDALRRLAA
jgi:hypothetical protein